MIRVTANRVLVTGGGGFLGLALTRKLVEQGLTVVSLSRSRYPALDELGVEQISADLADSEAIKKAFSGCDLVFHVAAKAGVWGDEAAYERANVTGSENVIAACRHHGITRLVYTSSPSVVFNGRSMEGVNESVPYPDHFHAPYPRTKALAEQKILAANNSSLATVALRPHLIWGPGDNHLVPRILERGRAGQLRRIGRHDHCVDTIYIDNAVDAHLLAAQRLALGAPCAGKAYFISQDDPRPLWDIVNAILAAGNVPPVTRSIPAAVAYAAGTILEIAYRVLNKQQEPRMTRFLARELTTAHWFDISAAKRDLGYAPRISIEEGMERLRQWLAQQG
ncbi:MAG: NAD-dependent epimerase/dehydratase family protein [Desulfuromonadaceae bacterium]|nr:NAD-dependent epimerase/dehydratase family protein [Desulfuromonadaceae bacterium]